MDKKHLLGMVFVLGVAFLGVFIASPSTVTVQADEFVLLDGYTGRFADTLGESLAFDFYNVQIKDTMSDTPIETPDFFVGIDGLFNHGRDARFVYAKPIGSANNWIQKKLIGFNVEDEKKYELMTVFNEDGSIDMTRTVLGIVPPEFSKGVPITTYAEPGSILSIEEQKLLKPDEDFTNVGSPKTSDSGFKDLVCFDDQFTGLPQTGRCHYLTVSQFGSVGEVKKDQIPKLKEMISAFVHKDKKKSDIEPTNEGVYDEGPIPTGPLLDNPDVVVEVDGKVLPKGEPPPTKVMDSVPIEVMGTDPSSSFLFTLPAKKLPLYTPSSQPLFFSTTSLFYEDFEGAFPSGNWSVSDLDSGNGSDYWDDTSATAHYGSWSAWAADVGDQWSTVATDSFNGSISGWTATDVNPTNGTDTWGYSTYKFDSIPGSAYSAGNRSTGGSHLYDNFMGAYFTKNTTYNASSWSSARIRFDTWYMTESGIDQLQVIVSSNGGSSWSPICTYSGNSSGWKAKECVVSSQYLTSQFKYGFHFQSDDTITFEGAYVDDVVLEKYVSNNSVSNYDDYQDSHMKYGPFSVSGYAETVFEFWIKGTPEPTYDNLWVQLSGDGSSWTTFQQINSSFPGWTQKSYPFTSTTGNAYFRLIFDTDDSVHNYTGYYIDDVKAYGNYLLPDGSICSSPSECQSGSCGGADTDYYIHCNTDGSSTVYANNLVYVNTCGGAGTYSQTQNDATNGNCSSGKVCDSDLAYTSENFSTSTICKSATNQSCSSSSECWNDNGGVDCQGPSGNKICTYGDNGSYCTADAHCDSGLVCDTANQVCSTGAGVGNACTNDSDCASKVCVYTSSTQATCQSAPTYSPYVLTTDTYDSAVSNSYSDDFDGVAFTGYAVKPVALDLKQSADYICYDFNNDGTYDACYYDTSVSSTSCNGVLSFPSSVPVKQQCDIDSYSGCMIGNGSISPQICSSGCAVNSNSIKKSDVRAKVFYDCDNSEQLQSATVLANTNADDYWIINPKFASCDSQSSPGSGYTIGGKYGTGYDSAKSLAAFSCSTNQSCSIAADEQYVSTATGAIPSVCKTKPNNSCTQNSDCLYNSCVGNVCQNGFIYESFILDALDNPLPNYTVKLTACSSGNTLQTTTTDADGKFTFVAPTGSYGMKLAAPWGDLDFDLGTDYCKTFSMGFHGSLEVWVYENKTVVHGKAVNPQGQPSISLPLELSTCQDSTLVSTTTNTSGDFILNTDSGKQKIKATISGNKVPLSDESGNTCFLNYGDVDLGTMEITPTCNLYDNTCQDPNTRIFSCVPDPSKGCVCQVQYCEAGCTEGASICNPLGTGTLKVSVTNANSPVKSASIKVDGSTQGKTNSLGKLEVNSKHGSHTVIATCPSGSPSNTKTVYLNADYQFVNINLNCPASPQKGDILIRAENVNGYPIANVLVAENDEKIGLTDSFGQLYLEDFDYGSHTISLVYRITNADYAGTYQKIVLVDLNQSVVTQEITILLPGDVGYSQFGETSYSGKIFLPVAAAVVIIAPIAFATLDAVSMAWSASDLCQCILGDTYSLSQLGQCVGDFANPTCSDIRQCEGGLEKYAKEISNGQCWAESAMLAGDVVSPFIPAGLVGHVGAFFISKIDDFKLIDKLGVAGKIVAKGEDFIEIVAENGAKLRAEIDDLAAQTILKGPNVGLSLKALSPDGIIGAGHVSTKLDSFGVDSVKISKDLTSVFSEQSMIDVYQTIGKADGKVNVHWVEEFSNRVKTFASTNSEKVGNAKGIINEIKVAKKEGIVDSLTAAAVTIYKNGQKLTDLDLVSNGILREVKSPFSLAMDADDDGITILKVIKNKVSRLEEAKQYLPSGISYNEIEFNIARNEGEVIPQSVIDALNEAKTSGLINDWKVVDV